MALRPKNISERAYLHIRETLLNSGVYVGQKILHHELEKKLRISQTPVREALFRLAAEGLLEHENYKGFSVPAITLEEAREIYETRELIEPYLAETATAVISSAIIGGFSDILEKYKQLMSEPYSRRRLLVDKKFHMEIAKLADNKTLSQMLNLICDKLILKSPLERLSSQRGKEAIKEHTEILRMLKKRESRRVSKLMKNHIRRQKNYILKSILSKQTGDILAPL